MTLDDTKKSYGISFLLHAALVLLFLIITVDLTPEISEFADLAFTVTPVKADLLASSYPRGQEGIKPSQSSLLGERHPPGKPGRYPERCPFPGAG